MLTCYDIRLLLPHEIFIDNSLSLEERSVNVEYHDLQEKESCVR